MKQTQLSIIVPTLNEEANIKPLVLAIDAAMRSAGITYEIIFVDDYSTDYTRHKILELIDTHPVWLYLKEGRRGKATSLQEGFSHAKYPLVCMIDADLQYPPRAIPKMLLAIEHGADIVVANRGGKHVSLWRKMMSRTFSLFLARFLHGIDCDVQSGLKVFRKEVFERVTLAPATWAFDLAFLLTAQQAGYKIVSVPIEFHKRFTGKSKVGFFKPAFEIGWSALFLKYKKPVIIPFHQNQVQEHGEGFHFRGNEFVYHTDLHLKESAFYRMTTVQTLLFLLGFEVLLAGFILWGWHQTLVVLLSTLVLLYVGDLLFNLFLVYRSFAFAPEITVSKKLLGRDRTDWPLYTIYCPLYKESVVVPQFIRAIQDLDYPKDRLQVLFLLEEDDKETIREVLMHNLPYYFTVLVVPDSKPKTKPKALNYGLKYTRGEYAVIYDAEDIPEPDQLKKAVLTFERLGDKTACVQAKLKFYNPSQNLLTRLFAADYSLWFDVVLPGLQSIAAPIPLGGTSNHFRTRDLKSLSGWDPFNVTEDADLGMRIIKRGFKTAIVNSYTYEEANSDLGNWFVQRSRWIKGYMQTYLVHTRNLRGITTSWQKNHFLIFQLVIGSKIVSMIINPLMWLMTIAYFAFRPELGMFIESLFPPVIFYLGMFSLVIGNFLYAYYYMLSAAKQESWEVVSVALLMPLYWFGISIAAVIAAFELVVRPYHWHKTKHGLHLISEQTGKSSGIPIEEGEIAVVPAA